MSLVNLNQTAVNLLRNLYLLQTADYPRKYGLLETKKMSSEYTQIRNCYILNTYYMAKRICRNF